jgi:predicted NBD/HSP70 family sugar kinase
VAQTVVRQLPRTPSDALVLDALLVGHALTRAQICAATGLSRPTVVEVLARMTAHGMIATEMGAPGVAGRIPELISINPCRTVGLAADVGGSKAVVSLVDYTGRIVAEVVEPTAAGAERVAEQLGTLRRQLAGQAGVSVSSIKTAVVGLPGVMDDTGRIMHGDNIPGLDKVDVRALLRRHLRCRVTVENDVNLAGLGELDADPTIGDDTFVLISLGTGLGMAVLHNGRVLRGATGRAGEIAFLPLFGASDDANVRLHGSAETMVSGPALERRFAAVAHRSSAEQILAAAADGDTVAGHVVREFAADLSRVVLSVAAVLDPARIVLGGGMGANPLVLEHLRGALERIAPFPISVVTSRLGVRSGIGGAIALARRDVCRILSETIAVGDDRATRPLALRTRGD